MGAFGIDSTSSATDNRIAATDAARVATQKNSLLVESGSIGVGTKGTYTESGGLNLANSKGANIGGLTTGANSTVTMGDGGAGAAAAAEIGKTLGDTATKLGQSNTDAITRAFGSLDTAATLSSGNQGNALAALLQLNKDTTSASARQLESVAGSNSGAVSSAIQTLSNVATTAQTGGISQLNKTFVWLIVAGVVLLGLFAWRR